MKLTAALMALLLFLTGCTGQRNQLDRATDLRKQILTASTCTFDTTIHANYEEEVYTFDLSCSADSEGNLTFCVLSPDSIADIRGNISDSGASLVFEDTVLAFPMLADGKVSPVTAPWLFMKTLRGGYLSGCAETDEGLLISLDDSYDENPLHVEICTDTHAVPLSADIYYQQQCVVTMQFRNFCIQ